MPQRSDRRVSSQNTEYALIAGVLVAAIIAIGFAVAQYYAAI